MEQDGVITCPYCRGVGKIQDAKEVGAKMRAARKKAGLTLREAARAIGWSAAYLSDLELGKRGWNAERQRTYLDALS